MSCRPGGRRPSHADVQAWITGLTMRRSPATVHKIHRVFSLMLKTAARDGRLGRNPADDIHLPRVNTPERRYLTHDQVRLLADACHPHSLVVLFSPIPAASASARWPHCASAGSI
jgi:integrase